MNDLDLEIFTEWLVVAQMVTDHSDKVEADIARVLDQWMTIEDDGVREQGLREMESVFAKALEQIRANLNVAN